MSDGYTRRQWLRTAAAVAAGGVLMSVATSCKRRSDAHRLPIHARKPEQPFMVAEDVVAQLPEEIPCVRCRRCMPCGYGVDIPAMFIAYNEALRAGEIPTDAAMLDTKQGLHNASAFESRVTTEIGDMHLAHRCAGCGFCLNACPRGIDIPKAMNSIGRFIDLIREMQCR